MNTSHNVALVTGGSAGIGFQIAKALLALGNQVIITGRNQERLDHALTQLPGATGIAGDVSDPADVDRLVTRIQRDFPALNLVVNNAGRVFLNDLVTAADATDKAAAEINTNYLAVIRLNERLLPLLKQQSSAAIVNVSSVVAYTPMQQIATYSASKAALHSYTQALRIALARVSRVQVFELLPPLVDTEFSAEIGGHNGIAPEAVASDLLTGLASDQYEIRVGQTQAIYDLHRQSPADALKALNP